MQWLKLSADRHSDVTSLYNSKVTVVPAKNMRSSQGVITYREYEPFKVLWCDVMLVAPHDAAAGVQLSPEGDLLPAMQPGEGCTLAQLLTGSNERRENQGLEATLRWLAAFQASHRDAAGQHTFAKGAWTFYVRGEEAPDDAMGWVPKAADTVPVHLHRAAQHNVARFLRGVAGVQSPYYYMSGNQKVFRTR